MANNNTGPSTFTLLIQPTYIDSLLSTNILLNDLLQVININNTDDFTENEKQNKTQSSPKKVLQDILLFFSLTDQKNETQRG